LSKLPEDSAPESGLQAFGSQSDREATRFLAFCADRLLHLLRPLPGERLLDVSAGNGIFTVAAAQAMQPSGRITAIDLSEQLLTGLEAKIRQFGIDNVDVHRMDGAHTDFRRGYFHHVVCSLGLHRFPDLSQAFREWHRVLHQHGRLACASFRMEAFQPQLGMLAQRLASIGHKVEIPWRQTSDIPMLESMIIESGYSDVTMQEAQLGYHLPSPEQWWEVIENSPLQAWLQPLSFAERSQLRTGHLADVAEIQDDKGLWLNIPVLLVLAWKH
jgi:ubiquinone/menaquinone biosynthesis C-methylase UbiE